MKLDRSKLWNADSSIYVLAHKEAPLDPGMTSQHDQVVTRQLLAEVGKLFDFHPGVRITGSLSIFGQLKEAVRAVKDVDVYIDRDVFPDVIRQMSAKGYVYCRMAQSEIKDNTRVGIFEEITPEQALSNFPSERHALINRAYVEDKTQEATALDIIDVFIRYTNQDGWICSHDRHLNPIFPEHFKHSTLIRLPEGNLNSVSLEYMAMVKAILLNEAETIGFWTRIAKTKSKFDLDLILDELGGNFRSTLDQIVEERRECRRKYTESELGLDRIVQNPLKPTPTEPLHLRGEESPSTLRCGSGRETL